MSQEVPLNITGETPLISRRSMLGTGALVAGSFAVGVGFTAPACNPKNLSVYVQTIVGALEEISPLLPNSAAIIAKAVKVAKDFDDAYRAGKFENALVLFENLAGFISQIANDVGVNNPTIQIALAVAGIALKGIAVLLKSQESEPQVVAAMERANAKPGAAARRSLVERLANPTAVEKAFAASRF